MATSETNLLADDIADIASGLGTSSFSAALTRFSTWLRSHGCFWSSVSLTGQALKPHGTWFLRTSIIELTEVDDDGSPDETGTDEIRFFRRVYPIKTFPSLIRSIISRKLLGEEDQAGRPGPVYIHESQQLDSVDGDAQEPARIESAKSAQSKLNLFRRFELDVRSSGLLQKLLAANSDRNIWLDSAERRFQALGRGTQGSVAVQKGLAIENRFLRDDSSYYLVRLVAPIPARMISVAQSPDRTQIIIETSLGKLMNPDDFVVRYRREPVSNASPAMRVSLGQGRITVESQAGDSMGTGSAVLVYRDEAIQSESFTVLPKLRTDVRLAAIEHIEGSAKLFSEGLYRRGGNWGGAADEFERSIGHFLSILGFNTMWWGPNASRDKQKLRQPQDAPDLLAFSSDNRICLVVECKTEQPGTDKVSQFLGRVNRLRARRKTSRSFQGSCLIGRSV